MNDLKQEYRGVMRMVEYVNEYIEYCICVVLSI